MKFSFQSMWNYKCPRCRKGDLYVRPFNWKKPLDMNKLCSSCGQSFEPETGFYYGALFVSYIFTGWYLLIPTLLLVFVLKWTIFQAMLVALLLTIISYFRILRGSRSLWLHLMVKYNPNSEK